MKRFLISDQSSASKSSSHNKILRDDISSVNTNESAASTSNSVRNTKSRRYDDNYLSLGFTRTTINGEDRPQCVVCLTVLASDSMKPNKLRRHLETKHAELVNKPKEYFARKLNSFKSTQQTFTKMTTVPSKALLASFKVSHKIAKCKKPHTIGETLILPAAVDIVSTMFGDGFAQQLKSIPLSNDTVSRRISDISEDLNEQLMEKLKNNIFGLQVDEATDKHRQSHLLAYVRFIDDKDIREEMLFCEPFTINSTGECIFKIIDNFFKQNNLQWEKCIGLCTDGARAMAGQYTGLQGLVKAVAPNVKWNHCIIHREALASKDLSPSLNEVLQIVVKTVNLIKAQPLQSRLFKVLCEDMGSEHTALLFHTEARWLSRGNVLNRIFELRNEVFMFLRDCNKPSAELFCDTEFLLKLAYLADIFAKLNILNKSLQKGNANILTWNEKVQGFVKKLSLWEAAVKKPDFTVFPTLLNMAQEVECEQIPQELTTCFVKHLSTLQKKLHEYFYEDLQPFYWIKHPFQPLKETSSLSLAEQEELIDLQCDDSLKVRFEEENSLSSFWISVKEEYPRLYEKATRMLIPFATTYLCETGFSALASMKSKYRGRLDISKELRVALSDISPRFIKLCEEKKQAHPSH